jgi:FG-GAP-like repeat
MLIILNFDSNALAAPQSFRDGVRLAANIIQAAFVDPITVTINVGYGEIDGTPIADPGSAEGGAVGIFESYPTLRLQLLRAASSPEDFSALSGLPDAASIQGHGSFLVPSAEAKAFGLTGVAGADGSIGLGTGITGNTIVSVALHELTHAMGRIDGAVMDLFRYTGLGTHLFGNPLPAPASYFSIDGGVTALADFGQNSDPGDFLNPSNGGINPNDAFNESYSNTTLTSLTTVDLQLMDVLGFHRATAPPPVVALGPHDFNGDGTSDMLWQNQQTGATYGWLMAGGQNAVDPFYGNLPGWTAIAAGDFNGDGTSDIMWQYTSTGATWAWTMKNGQHVADTYLGNLTGWTEIGTGDFNGDGTTDILWQNLYDGSAYEWTMKNGQHVADTYLGNLTGWTEIGTGDFNGDGSSDILWQNRWDGTVYEWTMKNGLHVADTYLGNLTGWTEIATGDFNGDGSTDILWQNKSNGSIYEWTMKNGLHVADTYLGALSGWSLVGTGDFNGDHTTDLMWRYPTNGATYLWTMRNGQHVGDTFIAYDPAINWRPT